MPPANEGDTQIAESSYPAHLLFCPTNLDYSNARLEAQDLFIRHLPEGFISSRVELKRFRNQTTFACRLPAEVICTIFALSAPESGWPRLTRRRRNTPDGEDTALTVREKFKMDLGWVAVTQVCSRWREVAFSASMLWTHPSDYLALPPSMASLIRSKSRGLPFHLELSAFGLRYLRRIGGRARLPAPVVPIVELRILLFTVEDFDLFERNYFPFGSFATLRRLSVAIDLMGDEEPLLLPENLCLSPLTAELDLYNCLPPRWDTPMFGAQLTHLTLSYGWELDVPEALPTPPDFSRILASSTSLEVLNLDNIFPVVSPAAAYPPMVVSPTLHSMCIFSWDNMLHHRDSLIFLGHLKLGRRDMHVDVALSDFPESDMVDADTTQDYLSLISSAIGNICRQQNPAKHLTLGSRAFLAHDSDESRSEERAWPISVLHHMHDDIPGITSLLSFSFPLRAVADSSSWHNGSIAIPLQDLRSISFECTAARAYLESEVWWLAFETARKVNRISIPAGDCAMLLPLFERVAENDPAFAIFPELKIVHIRVEDPYTADDLDLGDLEHAYAASLFALHFLIRVRRQHGAALTSLVVDEALKGWEIWSTIEADVPVTFYAFYSDDRFQT
ncbi:unnamed protein product [Peniophora sp. CBMAI 1063]|nr:unnamed protein product [Peniophora sp. CBMAI 1063]